MYKINVIDNFFDTSLINKVIQESYKYSWILGRTDGADDFYLTNLIYGSNYSILLEELTNKEFQSENVKNVWDFFKNKFNFVKDHNLDSCYANGMIYGQEGHPHVDFLESSANGVTVICYLCESWNHLWGGATCFYSGAYSKNPSDKSYYENEIIKSVLPRYNRVAIFDGNIVHSVSNLSKSFKGIRKTLMFKILNLTNDQKEELCS